MDTNTELDTPDTSPATDTLSGASAIAKWLGISDRKAFYLAETGKIPAYKLPGSRIWEMRKSTYLRRIIQCEAQASGSAA